MRHTVTDTATIARLIHQERKRQGLRQDDLAAMAGASDAFLRDVERGKPTVQLGKVLSVLDELGIRVVLELPGSTPIDPAPAGSSPGTTG